MIGGDSAGVAGLSMQVRADRKIFVNGEFAMGFTTSFRMGQLLAYSLTPPKRHPDADVMRFMVTDFVDAVRNCLKAGGYARRDAEAESAGIFLIGYAGRLFKIESDYQVAESVHDFAATGCGEDYAIGTLFNNSHLGPDERIAQALATAELFSAGVRGPFHIVSTP